MYSEPGSESNRALEFVAMFANFSHGGIAPDHRHDSFVQVPERLFWLASYRCRNIFCTPFAGLFRHGCKLWQRLAVRAGDIRKISERVDAREILNAKVGLDIETSAMAGSYANIVRQRGRFQTACPNYSASKNFSSVREQHMAGTDLLSGDPQPHLNTTLLQHP